MTRFRSAYSWRSASPSLALIAAAALLLPAAASATPFVVHLVQHTNNVVAVGTGAIDLTGLTPDPGLSGSQADVPGLIPQSADVSLGPTTSYPVMAAYTGFTGPDAFGTTASQFATSGSGDVIEITGNGSFWGVPALFVQTSYVSDTALFGTAIFDGASFASLGVTPGTYVWTWGPGADQSFTLTTEVPEPAALGMFGLGVLLIGGLVVLRRRTRRLA